MHLALSGIISQHAICMCACHSDCSDPIQMPFPEPEIASCCQCLCIWLHSLFLGMLYTNSRVRSLAWVMHKEADDSSRVAHRGYCAVFYLRKSVRRSGTAWSFVALLTVMGSCWICRKCLRHLGILFTSTWERNFLTNFASIDWKSMQVMTILRTYCPSSCKLHAPDTKGGARQHKHKYDQSFIVLTVF